MEKKIIAAFIFLLIISGLLGYIMGFSAGASYAIEKGLRAAEVMLDIELTGKAKNMIMSFPNLLDKIPAKVRAQLELNNTEYENYLMQEMNETITKLIEARYPKP